MSWSGRSCWAGSRRYASAGERVLPGRRGPRLAGAPRLGRAFRGSLEKLLLKVAVYTIALNESANVERWASSAVDADYRIVADTGSTDGTVERLTAAGVTVHRITVR